jgi:hypothetical protein
MQIYELTTRQLVNEISFKDIGKAIVQAPVKVLGNKVGVDLTGNEKTKSATELMYDMQKYFGFAKQQLHQGMPEHIIISELIGKYGANQEQATKALEAAQQQLHSISQPASQSASQAGSQAFGTMANQLGQTGPAPAATTTPSAPVPAPVPQSPEEIRKAKQAVAAQAVQKNMAANSAPAPAVSTSAPTPTTPNFGSATGPGVQPQTSVFPSSYTGTSAVPAQQKPSPAPNFSSKVGPGVQPQMTATPTMKAPTTPTSAAPATQQPISIGGQKIKANDPLYSKIQQQLAKQKSAAVAESLIWSRNFDPSRTLLKKIKQV